MRKILASFSLAAVMLCVPVYAQDDIVVAKIGDKKIMMSDLNRLLGYYDEEKQKLLEQNPQFKATLLQRFVQGIVISKLAREKGFDKKADVREQLELLSNDFLSTEYLKREVLANITVTEEDISLYYKSHQEEFRTPEMVRARHILVITDKAASEEAKQKAKEKAGEILKKIRAGEDFAKLASELSDDLGSKSKGGDLGFFQKGKMIPDFEKVAFSLKPGEVSDVFETPFGFHIVRVEEKKEAALEPYDKVKDKVKEKITSDFRKARLDAFAEKAMKDAGVELNLEPFMPKK